MSAPEPAGSRPRHDPALHRVVLDDLRRPGIGRTLKGELRDLYTFYLDGERRARLESMGRVRRSFVLLWWLLKELILRLAPLRRLLLVLALLLALQGRVTQGSEGSVNTDLRVWSIALLLFILALELKDKLLVRDEIDVARQVQRDLLPRQHPVISGWEIWSHTRPANDVGGDLVDYVPVGGAVGCALGDVAGKGMGAALLMAKLQATLRAMVEVVPDLAALGARLNTILLRDGLDNRFATLLLACVEPDSGQVRLLNAGHNPPLVTRASQPEGLAASGPPLGMLPDSVYTQTRLQLAPGEMLIAYSDGLTEATDADGREFGMERLTALAAEVRHLAPAAAGACILAAVDRFAGGERLGDDLSLLILRRGDAGAVSLQGQPERRVP